MGRVEDFEEPLRAEYAFLFSAIVRLYKLRFGEEILMGFPEIKKGVFRLEESSYVDEYLKENLDILLRFYEDLDSGRVASIYKKGEEAFEEKMNGVISLVRSIRGDLTSEIAELDEEASRSEMESFLKKAVGR